MKGRAMLEKYRKLSSNMTFNVTAAIILLLTVFGIIVGAIGIFSFTVSFRKENSTTSYHMANTAATLVNGDHIKERLLQEHERLAGIRDRCG